MFPDTVNSRVSQRGVWHIASSLESHESWRLFQVPKLLNPASNNTMIEPFAKLINIPNFSGKRLAKSESFWDRLGPGTFCCSAAVLAHGHTSPRAIRYKETIWDCMQPSWGKFWIQKIQRDQKTQLPLLKSLEQKQVWEQKPGTVHALCTQHHLRGEQNT